MQNPETLRATIEAAAGMGSTAAVAPAESDVETPEEAEAREIKEVQHWASEIELGEKFIREWREKAGDAVDAYLSENDTGFPAATNHRLNLFHANVSTLMSMLAGNTPKVEADRRFADPTDDIGRVASEIVTRILQNDLNDPDDTYVTVLRQSLQDRLLAGLGVARVRYAMEEGQDELGQPAKIDEWCEIDYHHWRDIVWSPCRTPYELRWKAFRVYMDKAEATARFGAEKAALLN